MAPRAYKLQRRAEAVEKTRRRITEAVVHLHREKGVLATTYDEIARRADVAPATVYRHFPSVDDLIPACGARIQEITTPPGPDIFEGSRSPAERLRALVEGLFDYWRRVEPWLSVGRCEAPKVPSLAAYLGAQEESVRALVASALSERADDRSVRLVQAMTDFDVWRALARQGLEREAADLIHEILANKLQFKSRKEHPIVGSSRNS